MSRVNLQRSLIQQVRGVIADETQQPYSRGVISEIGPASVVVRLDSGPSLRNLAVVGGVSNVQLGDTAYVLTLDGGNNRIVMTTRAFAEGETGGETLDVSQPTDLSNYYTMTQINTLLAGKENIGASPTIWPHNIWITRPGATQQYDFQSLATALTAAQVGDCVHLPGGVSISGNHTIPDNITVRGHSRHSSILTGQITVGNSRLEQLSILRSADSGSTLAGLIGPASSKTAVLRACTIQVIQAGAGAAYAVSATGGGQVNMHDCELLATSEEGEGYAVYLNNGNVYWYHGRAYGSTDRFKVE